MKLSELLVEHRLEPGQEGYDPEGIRPSEDSCSCGWRKQWGVPMTYEQHIERLWLATLTEQWNHCDRGPTAEDFDSHYGWFDSREDIISSYHAREGKGYFFRRYVTDWEIVPTLSLKADDWITITGRDDPVAVFSDGNQLPDDMDRPEELMGRTIRVDGKLYKVCGVETYSVPGRYRLSFGLMVQPVD